MIDAVRYMDRLAERHSVRIEFDVREGLSPIQADRGALFVLLKNLIENAIFHSPPQTTVRISLDASQLAVEDEGDGVAAEHLAKLFTRFWRGEERKHTGAGLGLAICRQIAETHG